MPWPVAVENALERLITFIEANIPPQKQRSRMPAAEGISENWHRSRNAYPAGMFESDPADWACLVSKALQLGGIQPGLGVLPAAGRLASKLCKGLRRFHSCRPVPELAGPEPHRLSHLLQLCEAIPVHAAA